MVHSSRISDLDPLLKSVSRSFHLTLRVLPVGMRDPVGLAYLLARAADTIADTSIVPPEQRLELLLWFRNQIDGSPYRGTPTGFVNDMAGRQTNTGERALLASLGTIVTALSRMGPADRQAIGGVVNTLIGGMEFDLMTFPGERSGHVAALQTADELDRYTYMVAGCVGEFWTAMTYAHVPGALTAAPEPMVALGIRFGKALQMTNVLRDCDKDLKIGRCYLPAMMLAHHGLVPHDLLLPEASQRTRPLLVELIRTALEHFRAAVAYTIAIARFSVRLRLACLWPIVIGLETLLLLVGNDGWLSPGHASKVSRRDVYRIIANSMTYVASNALLQARSESLIRKIEDRLVLQ